MKKMFLGILKILEYLAKMAILDIIFSFIEVSSLLLHLFLIGTIIYIIINLTEV